MEKEREKKKKNGRGGKKDNKIQGEKGFPPIVKGSFFTPSSTNKFSRADGRGQYQQQPNAKGSNFVIF